MENETRQRPPIMELIANAPWREALTYRETWPHEYVVVNRDGQQELMAAFCERISRGDTGKREDYPAGPAQSTRA